MGEGKLGSGAQKRDWRKKIILKYVNGILSQ